MRINPSICFAFSGAMFALTGSMASPDLSTSNTPNVPTGAICSSDRSTRGHSDVRHQIASPIRAAAVDQRHMTMTEAVPKNPRRPPICSSIAAGDTEVNFPFCRVTPTAGKPGQHDVTLSLTATTSPVEVGGYLVSATDNYNGGYLAPIIELNPGDTFNVRLVNALSSTATIQGMPHPAAGAENISSTNLHTHGLIVSPKNASSNMPQNGDNVFVTLGRGQSLDYKIDIPTELPASMLDGTVGFIPHPNGLYWYHAPLHELSSRQVGGGMSGLLSIGSEKSNLVDVDAAATDALRSRTDVSYVMLRDIQIASDTDPKDAKGRSPATWQDAPNSKLCEPSDGQVGVPPAQRDGYCQDPKDKSKIWLFTVNGERYPTIRVPSGRNSLLRIANLSPAASYMLGFVDQAGKPVPFYLVSVDGVVPGTPFAPTAGPAPLPEAQSLTELLLMPAARAEIFIDNDQGVTTERQLVFRTAGLNTAANGAPDAGDPWPEIKLASVILEGAPVVAQATATKLALNVPMATGRALPKAALEAAAAQPAFPPGCLRDIDKTKLEHRRITFAHPDDGWMIFTDLMRPKDPSTRQKYPDGFTAVESIAASFDQYVQGGSVDWEAAHGAPKHTCVSLRSGHGQLWVLSNPTTELHNFHIHQSKFRLATDEDLKAYRIAPGSNKVSEDSGLVGRGLPDVAIEGSKVWHDTLPVEPNSSMFIVINFDAEEQLGRYVFHCYILPHEDGA